MEKNMDIQTKMYFQRIKTIKFKRRIRNIIKNILSNFIIILNIVGIEIKQANAVDFAVKSHIKN